VTRTVVQPLPVDLAVKTALATIGKPVGFAEAPPGALAALQGDPPGSDYLILYPINSVRDGSLGDPFADAEFVYQVTAVGRLADGVRWLVSRIETALLGVTVADRAVIQVIPEDDGAVRLDSDVTPPVFLATPRYRLVTVPT
jgi:hypothetical protein